MNKNQVAFTAACAGMFLFGITLITLGSVATDLKLKFQLNGVAAGTFVLHTSVRNPYRLLNFWSGW
jgi:hypothetical protein